MHLQAEQCLGPASVIRGICHRSDVVNMPCFDDRMSLIRKSGFS